MDPQTEVQLQERLAQLEQENASLKSGAAPTTEVTGADPFAGKPILDILAAHPGVNASDESGNVPTLVTKLQRIYEHGLAVESDILTPETSRVVNSLLVKVVEGLLTKVV